MRTRSSIWRVGSKKRKLRLSLIGNSKAAKSSIERKLMQLQKLIPGCIINSSNPETMFQEIANYIFLLEAKVNILRLLATSYGV
ncbi:hypothetical protein PRUPE_1G097700 [Prunus persica]|uniref:Uncharacterized protein n=2 Tax=Prunus TaxID=3754 RepID=A0AAD4WTE9_PRUDU|nr:hypothetical protein L3X38_001843 [Prunus dulcis]ONI27640.1 hypothetical protein PRUPE_1G097700 [Prunus persica]